MQQLTEVLDHEISTLDTVLLRVTTLRLLLAAGKHEMVLQSLEELDDSVAGFEEAARRSQQALLDAGFSSFLEAKAALDVRERVDIDRRLAAATGRRRDVRVALAATGGIAERAIKNAQEHLPGATAPENGTHRRHPFMTGV